MVPGVWVMRDPRRGPVLSRQWGVASSALPAPEPLESRQSAIRMVGLLPHACLVVRVERAVTGIKGSGSQWGPWRVVPDARRAPGHTYPIDRPHRRLPDQLVDEVADLIERDGNPPLHDADRRRLASTLSQFLHR